MVMRYRLNRNAEAGTGADGCNKVVFEWLNFMRTASPVGPGWTIYQSSDGYTAGYADYIADYNDLNRYTTGSYSWFVLQDPSGVGGREIMFYRYSGAGYRSWRIAYAPHGGFQAGTIAAAPLWPADGSGAWIFSGGEWINDGGVLHMGADDEAPYEFWAFCNQWNDFTISRFVFILAAITDDSKQPTDIDPVVIYTPTYNLGLETTSFFYSGTSNWNGAWRGYNPVTGTYPVGGMAANRYRNEDRYVVPNGLPVNVDDKDFSFPIMICRATPQTSPGYKGFINFVRLNGVSRPPGSTFANKTRFAPVTWLNVPWDGVTVPRSSL
jgi:hypothetical protein